MSKSELSEEQKLTQELISTDECNISQESSDYLLPLTHDEANKLQTALSLAIIRLKQEDDKEYLTETHTLYNRVKFNGLIKSE
jgi:hypothetical protein